MRKTPPSLRLRNWREQSGGPDKGVGQFHVESVMRSVFGVALLAGAIASNAAMAADVRLGSYFWQGPYVGANLGYQWGATTNSATRPANVAGGLQVGYNWQRSQFVFGAETDLQLSAAEDTFAPWKFSNPWFGTLRGRAGIALNNVMFYGTVGLAYGTLRAQSTLTGASESRTRLGWAAGVGMEIALMGNWTGKAEYLYVDLSDQAFGLTGAPNGLESNVVRLGVNYRF
jgi:outer membrane immunogenic protein